MDLAEIALRSLLTALRNVAQLLLHFVLVDEAPRLQLHATRIATKVVSADDLRVIGGAIKYLPRPRSTFGAVARPVRCATIIFAITVVARVFCSDIGTRA